MAITTGQKGSKCDLRYRDLRYRPYLDVL